jgi:hypothetical protein
MRFEAREDGPARTVDRRVHRRGGMHMVDNLLYKLGSATPAELWRRGLRKLVPYRLRFHGETLALFEAKTGLELGGPSTSIFARRGLFPVYPVAARIDNCNFGQETLWEGSIRAQNGFSFDKRRARGQQFVAEATDLSFLADGSYDFLLSSHMLEHSANPLKALHEWLRVLKPDGTLFLVLPHRDGTFDHRRPVTSLQHLVEDFELRRGEDDLTHLPEILELHDLRRDPGAGSFNAFKARSEKNLENRGLHHHVFDTRAAIELLDYLRLQIRAVEVAYPYHIAILATRPKAGAAPDNEAFLSDTAAYRRASPFNSDRTAAGRF